MSTTNNDHLTMPYADWLNAVHRLRLLRNTTRELSEVTKIQLHNNSFNKKSSFIARCIYSEFCREAQKRTNVDLDKLMCDYNAASRSFEKIAKPRKNPPEFYREVLRCLLDEKFAASEAAAPYRAAAEDFLDVDVAILILLVLKILPSFQSKGGDVDPNTHLEHLNFLRDFFQPLYEGCRIFKFAPYLTKMYQDAARHIQRRDLYTRLDLIHFTQEIITNLKNNYIPSQLLQANRHYAQYKIQPNFGQSIWTEYGRYGKKPVYWKFEPLGEDFIVIRREYDRTVKRITEIRYELILLQEKEDILFRMLRQSEVESICKGLPIPEHAYMQGTCKIDDLQQPKSIEWTFTTNCYDNFPGKMIQTVDPIVDLAAKEGWDIVCQTGDYEYLPAERVVTSYHVYIEHSSRYRESGGREILSWYKIPREGLFLEEDLMQATIVRIQHDNHDYICFISLNYSIEVTSLETCAAAGIEITDHIEVITPIEVVENTNQPPL